MIVAGPGPDPSPDADDMNGERRMDHQRSMALSDSNRARSVATSGSYGEAVTWNPQAPRYRVLHLLLSWLVAGVAVFVSAAIVPHVSVGRFSDALAAAALIAALNAVFPPIVAALRLPFTLALGF